MKHVFFRLFATLLCLACAVVPLHVQAAALQQELSALARPASGLVGLSPAGALLRSTDNGVTWTEVRAADPLQALYAVAAYGSTVIAMGDAGYFVRSEDDGITWTTLDSPVDPVSGGAIYALAANDATGGTSDDTTWIAVGKKGDAFVALRSADDGGTWSVATSLPDPSFGGSLHGVAWSGGTPGRWVAVGGDNAWGYTTTSTDGNIWTDLVQTGAVLYAVASNGSGTLIATGTAGEILRSTDSGTSFTAIDDDIVSEDLRSVTFLSGSSKWIIGGNSAVLVSIADTTPTVISAPSETTSDPITALIATADGTDYDYYSPDPGDPEPTPHGPISLQIAVVAGQLQLTLTGAENGNSYQLETSTTLTSWTAVPDSTVTYDGVTAPSWNFALPVGDRVFYRANVATP